MAGNDAAEQRLRVAAVVLAAGSGSRVGGPVNKVLLPLAGRPVLAWSLHWLTPLSYVDRLVVVVREAERSAVEQALAGQPRDIELVSGGETRHGSEWNALRILADDIDAGRLDVVAIHDSARPFGGTALFEEVVATAAREGGALPVRPQPGLVGRDGGRPGGELVGVQTPQAFRATELLAAYRAADRDRFEGTDTASCVEKYTSLRVVGVPAPATNLKVTFPEDVALAERLLPHLL